MYIGKARYVVTEMLYIRQKHLPVYMLFINVYRKSMMMITSEN